MNIALICEGVSEINMITNLIQRYTGISSITPIQPKILSNSKQNGYGSYQGVISHCNNKVIKNALDSGNDFVVIQIDTDVSKDYVPNFSLQWSERELFDEICKFLLKDINQEYHDKIIFAICFNETECWFLPFFYSDNKKCKITGCVETLNRALKKGNYISVTHDKNCEGSQKAYKEVFSKLRDNKRNIKEYSQYNFGFKKFIEDIDKKLLKIETEE